MLTTSSRLFFRETSEGRWRALVIQAAHGILWKQKCKQIDSELSTSDEWCNCLLPEQQNGALNGRNNRSRDFFVFASLLIDRDTSRSSLYGFQLNSKRREPSSRKTGFDSELYVSQARSRARSRLLRSTRAVEKKFPNIRSSSALIYRRRCHNRNAIQTFHFWTNI